MKSLIVCFFCAVPLFGDALWDHPFLLLGTTIGLILLFLWIDKKVMNYKDDLSNHRNVIESELDPHEKKITE